MMATYYYFYIERSMESLLEVVVERRCFDGLQC